jgi:hypothetical protein
MNKGLKHGQPEEMKAIHQAAADAFGLTLLAFAPVIFFHPLDFVSDKRLAISLLEPGIAPSKLTSKSQSFFAKTASETSGC